MQFDIVNIDLKPVDGAYIPEQANSTDVGYDIIAASEPNIVGTNACNSKALYTDIQYIEYKTNLFVAPEQALRTEGKNFHTLVYPRSSISKYNLVLANSVAVIDEQYRNQILVRFKYIVQPSDIRIPLSFLPTTDISVSTFVNLDRIYKKGDKIAQLVVSPTYFANFRISDCWSDKTQRGLGGLGSSGN